MKKTLRSTAALVFCAAATSFAAETRTEIDVVPAGSNGLLNAARCSANTAFFTASWDFGADIPTGTDLTVFISKKSACDETDTANTVATLRDQNDATTRADAFPHSGEELLPQTIAGADCGGAGGKTGEAFFCVVYVPPATSAVKKFGSEKIAWDTQPPTAPAGIATEGGNRNVKITWTAPATGEGVKSFIVKTKLAADGTLKREDTVGATSTQATVSGLDNGVTYEFTVRAIDAFGNEGPESEPVAEEPVPTADFWVLYKEAGGKQAGGCGTAGVPGAAGFFALGLGALLLRRRRVAGPAAGAALAAGLFLAPAAARADAPPRLESDQRFAFELKLGSYVPGIDKEFPNAAQGPYSAVFGGNRELLWQVELDYQALRFWGTWSVGMGVGFFEDVGKARFGSFDALGGASSDTILFRLVPLEALVVYRFDEAVRRWNIPLVPYGKIGALAGFWWSQGPGGQISVDSEGVEARGVRFGFTAAGGLMFLLDFIDPGLARELDADAGINNSYLFAEYRAMQFLGPGFQLSDATVHFGLAMEF